MSGLAELQGALDLYGAAAYWAQFAYSAGEPYLPQAIEVSSELRVRAAAAGCSDEQLDDASSYGKDCFRRQRKPLRAEVSFAEFCRINSLQLH